MFNPLDNDNECSKYTPKLLNWVNITEPSPRKFIKATNKSEAMKILNSRRKDTKQLLRGGITI